MDKPITETIGVDPGDKYSVTWVLDQESDEDGIGLLVEVEWDDHHTRTAAGSMW